MDMDMKITREEFEAAGDPTAGDPIGLFMQGIRSEQTKTYYTRMLRRVLCDIMEDVLDGTFEQRAGQLVRMALDEPGRTLGLMLHISRKLRERTELPHDHPDYVNPSSVRNYFNPIKKLFYMNNVPMQWKRVHSTWPEHDNMVESRGWERREILLMLGHARSLRNRALILVAASSGIRVGGFELLKWSDLRPVYMDARGKPVFDDVAGDRGNGSERTPACAMLTVYGRTSSSYPAFITPEAHAALMEYRGARERRTGVRPGPDEPMFQAWREDGRPAAVGVHAVQETVKRIAVAAGLRDPGRKKYRRQYDVPIMNGFRRFWNKTCKESMSKESALSSLIKKEYMMGHVGLVSLDRNYFKTHVLELAEEYLQSVPALTIDDAERLRLENKQQARRIGVMKDERDTEIAALKRTVEEMAKRMENMAKGRDGPS
ncbi:MAG: integrase [Nitrosopumilaceae archaeon]|nr:integrase [Nitrosopumilaceae archaeon]